MSVKRYILSALLLLIVIGCMGVTPTFSTFSVENGLSSNHVKAIYQDSHGFMWFGTIEGLDRYDGYEIKPFNGSFPSGPQNINCLYEDRNRNLWIGTERGLYIKKDGESVFDIVLPDSLSSRVTFIQELNSGELALGTDHGIMILEPSGASFRNILFSDDVTNPINYLTGIYMDSTGSTWISTQGGLVRMQKSTDVFEIIKNPLSQGNMFSAIAGRNGKIYLGTRSSGLVIFNMNDRTFSKVNGLNNKIILCLAAGTDGKIYIGTDGGGLNILDVQSSMISSLLHDPTNPATIGSNSIYSFYSGSNGHLWIGTFSAGVSHGSTQNMNFSVYTPQGTNILLNKSIRSLCFLDDIKLLGSREGFYSVQNTGGNTVTDFYRAVQDKPGLRANIVTAIATFRNKILVGTYGGGISEFNVKTKKFTSFLNEPYFQNGFIYYFEEDKLGNLWIASLNGLYRFNPENRVLDHFTTENTNLSSNEIFSLLFDKENNLWVGTMNGLNVFSIKETTLTPVTTYNYRFFNFKINYIFEDSQNDVWICTEAGGLFLFDSKNEKFQRYTEEDGLSGNSVCAIVESSPGTYWISTLRGLCKMTGSIFRKYSVSDGLPGLAFSPAAVHRKEDGSLWLGNENGLVYFYPDSVRNTTQDIPVQITDFFLFGNKVVQDPEGFLKKPIESTKEIILPGNKNSIGFRFAALNYIDASDNRYEYRLEGLSDKWNSTGSSNQVFFEKLKPGRYIFSVRPEGQSNVSYSVKSVTVVIKSLLFRHPVFLSVISIIAVVGGIMLYMRFRRQSEVINRFREQHKPHEKYEHSRLNDSMCEEIISKLKSYMEGEKPYLDGNLKLADVANKIGCPAYALSQVLNLKMNQSFTDYINHYRIEEVKKRMLELDLAKYKLMTIAKDCGFNSKTSFHRIFKNMTGFTPAEYITSVKNPD